MSYYRKFLYVVSAIAFTILFPLFFFYHFSIANGYIAPIFGGLFGPATVFFLPFLILSLFNFLRQPEIVEEKLIVFLFFGLVSWSIFWIALHAFFYPDDPAHQGLIQTCVFWISAFSIGVFFPIYSDRMKIFVALLWAGIVFLSVGFVDAAMLMTEGTSEESATYQGLARSLMITSFFVLSCMRQTGIRWAFAGISILSLFLIGARSELYGFIGAYTVFEFVLNRNSIISRAGFAVALFVIVAVVANNFEYLSVSRQFEVFNLSDSASWQARQYFQTFAIFQIKSNPIFGVYGGHFVLGEGDYAHNALSAWVSLGLPGFLLYVFLCAVGSVSSLRCLIGNPSSRLARMAAMVNFATALLIIASQAVFWEVPGLAWGLALAALVERRRRRNFNLVSGNSMSVKRMSVDD
ncbi:MAG: hypothetical protein U0S50_07635 [Sphingopyxis sp.]|uniref:O-antigen ligase family protein n=1 Tax=Sphingopyxis sp. TaxID=1908224 RepID=UPI002AB9AD3F|nr:hypothetical protein [Sphingopyxis sp.]MDZ3831673.1 hypothetical protein [Sphingopyxis sp.]